MLFLFDINETLLDLTPVDEVLAASTQDATSGRALREEWFDALIRLALTLTAADRYEDFGRLGAASAAEVAERHGGHWDDDDSAALKAAMGRLPAHPDVVPTFSALRDRGDRIVPFGNSNAAAIETQLEATGLADLVETFVSVESTGALKPSPTAYAGALAQLGAQPSEAVMVAAHGWDVLGAASAGMRTVFVSRDGRRTLPADPRPTVTVTTLTDLVDALG